MRIATYIIAFIVILIAVRIEILNIQAGGILPNTEYRNNDPQQGVVKWRQDIRTSEKLWRKLSGPRDESGKPINRPLTHAEEAKMMEDTQFARANNALRDFVSFAGLLQYLLVPVLFILSIISITKKPINSKTIALDTFTFLVSIGGGIMMFSRAYFSSLGW